MIKGTVDFPDARVRVKVRGRQGSRREIEAIVDTGYTGSLSLPPTSIAELGLRWKGYDRAILADGSDRVVDVFFGKVFWDGRARGFWKDEVDCDPLVGMELLHRYELKIQVRAGGSVTIKRLTKG